jgi:hypothetical protein
MHELTASHCAHDFQLVSIAELGLLKLAARHNFTIAFNGKALALQTKLGDQLVYCQLGVFEISGISVDSNLNQLN